MRKGFTCSCFDLLHAGHVTMLKNAKEECDYLIVLLQTDPTIDRPEKNKPVQSMHERYIQVSGLECVDEVIPYDTEENLYKLMQLIDADVRIIGEEYRGKSFTGHDLPFEIVYNKRRHSYSSSELRRRLNG